MAEIAKKPIKITETILRDAHQSLIATRMKIHGRDFVNSVTDSRTQNCRCYSADRTFWDTVHTQMTW